MIANACRYDDAALHILAFDGDTPIGTVRMVYIDGKYKLGRLAVRKQSRGKRIAQMLVGELE